MNRIKSVIHPLCFFLPIATILAVTLSPLPLYSAPGNALTQGATLIRAKDYATATKILATAESSPQRTFMLALAALRQGKADQAQQQFSTMEVSLPLVADYACFYQAEALFKAHKYLPAATMAAAFPKRYPSSNLIRRAHKLQADSLFQAGNIPAATASYQRYLDSYRSGSDRIEAEYALATCLIMAGDHTNGAAHFRSIWLDSPQSKEAKLAAEQLTDLAKKNTPQQPYSADQLLTRARILLKNNCADEALQTLQSIPREHLAPTTLTQIDLQSGMASYRLRNWKQADSYFAQAATSAGSLATLAAEALYWQAKTAERLNQTERAYTLYQNRINDGKCQAFTEESIMGGAAIRRSQGEYREAAQLYDRITADFPRSGNLVRAQWESAWCSYLGGDYPAATEKLKRLTNDQTVREKALYWLARTFEKNGQGTEAASRFTKLLKEYPAGFYATWYRDTHGVKDTREPLGTRRAPAALPPIPGYDKPRLLAALGLYDEARNELRALRKNNDEPASSFPALARLYLEIEDYGTAISFFLKSRPLPYNNSTMPLWSAGYPLVYDRHIQEHAARNGLSAGLVLGLMRAESAFSPTVRSPVGAIGLMQLMPATAKMTAREKGSFNPLRLTDPEYNITLGTKHLRDLFKSYHGDGVYVIAAYNAGSGAVDRWRKTYQRLEKDEFIESIPYQETRDYVKKVYASAQTYRQLYGLP